MGAMEDDDDNMGRRGCSNTIELAGGLFDEVINRLVAAARERGWIPR